MPRTERVWAGVRVEGASHPINRKRVAQSLVHHQGFHTASSLHLKEGDLAW